MISLTPTKLRDYLVCPQAYKLKHLERRSAAATSPALAFGRSLHSALEALHRPGAGPAAERDVRQVLAACWEHAYSDPSESQTRFNTGCAALERYVDGCKDPGETLGVEVFMSRVFTSSGVRLRLGCKADRVWVAEDGALVITDYKTTMSGRVPTAESLRADLPTFIYYVLARSCYPEYQVIRVVLLNVLTLARVEVRYEGEQVTTNKAALLEVVGRIAGGEFAARMCQWCAWCAVREQCPVYDAEVSFDTLR